MCIQEAVDGNSVGGKKMIGKVKYYVILLIRKWLWRINNRHNFTTISTPCPANGISVGKMTYGNINLHYIKTKSTLKIGNYCSIADNVMFLLNAEHPIKTMSTYPYKV